jgi:hypothetical protein
MLERFVGGWEGPNGVSILLYPTEMKQPGYKKTGYHACSTIIALDEGKAKFDARGEAAGSCARDPVQGLE